jgi:hypothetical protein
MEVISYVGAFNKLLANIAALRLFDIYDQRIRIRKIDIDVLCDLKCQMQCTCCIDHNKYLTTNPIYFV